MILVLLLSGLYTFVMLNVAGTKGVYDTPETGMRSILDRYYSPDRKIRIIYAGTNSFDGSDPHIWYVIYEVRASSHADGSPLHKNGCDSGGHFFLNTRKGWVPVSEGGIPGVHGLLDARLQNGRPGTIRPVHEMGTRFTRPFLQ